MITAGGPPAEAPPTLWAEQLNRGFQQPGLFQSSQQQQNELTQNMARQAAQQQEAAMGLGGIPSWQQQMMATAMGGAPVLQGKETPYELVVGKKVKVQPARAQNEAAAALLELIEAKK